MNDTSGNGSSGDGSAGGKGPTGDKPGAGFLVVGDKAGTVLYSRAEPDGDRGGAPPDVSGRNFFAEVAAFENAEELRQRIEGFARGGGHADNFHFDCRFGGDSLSVKALLARIRGRTNGSRTKSALVHNRRV